MDNPLFLLGAGFNKDAKKEANIRDNNIGYPLATGLEKICFPAENNSSDSVEIMFQNSINKNDYEPIKKLCDSIMELDNNIISKLLPNQNNLNCYLNFINKFKESSFLTFNYDSLVEKIGRASCRERV